MDQEFDNYIWAVETSWNYYYLKKAKITVEDNNGYDPESHYNDGQPFKTNNIRIGEFDDEDECLIDFNEIHIDFYSGKVVDHDLNESDFEKLQQQFGLEFDGLYKDNIEWEERSSIESSTFKSHSEAYKEFENEIKWCLKP